jgi:hypothetical protein
MTNLDDLTELGTRGRVPRRPLRRSTDRGTGRWTAVLALAAGITVVVPAVVLLGVVS